MPRLQILHHKSYHPYLEKNKQRVREDEARARAEALAKEQLQVDEEAANRLDILRRRAGSPSLGDDLPSTSASRDSGKSLLERHREKKAKEEKRERKKRDRLDFDFPSETARRNKGKEKEQVIDEEEKSMGKWETGGHLNLFADLERDPKFNKPAPSLEEIAKAKKDKESDPFTLYLGRPDKETKPWYADKDLKRVEDREIGEEAEERRERDRRKDARSKNRNDPLTHISTLLSTSQPKSRSSNNNSHYHSSISHKAPNAIEARQARETSERERALALIAKSKAPPRGPRTWDDTPSSAGGGRSWAEEWEREQAKAGRRFFERPPNGARSWEV
ncbi:uncharacterized protein I206_100195 [Kwoniella pini CBS 10737]|uniref:CBF1-interacting co-repressor CIR N-terminal domain-containing protein n=1 Tax=Kwoniella pini CBS 10737 TaxID=1296096 RepID=A0A1B9IE58_9TREE|nr:uncharacterized protein I206_01130 [Kwoniella pini CBS 10737]OCF53823.1 hypothetical protein I206_01130 [Kwoniella pini CBS 10737]